MGDHKKTPTEVLFAMTLRERIAISHMCLGGAMRPGEFQTLCVAIKEAGLEGIESRISDAAPGERLFAVDEMSQLGVFRLSSQTISYLTTRINGLVDGGTCTGAGARVLVPLLERLRDAKDGRYELPAGLAAEVTEEAEAVAS